LERVLVRKVADLSADVAEALDFLEYDFAGKRVWVKPNLIGPHPPEHGVTTDPELIRQVVRGLRTRGARDIWVADNPGGGLQRNVSSYIAPTGVVEASEGCFRGISETPVSISMKSRFISEITVSRIVNEVDVILNLPVFKTHALTLLTGAIKNLFGIIPGAQKSYLHTVVKSPYEFAELLVDIYQAIPVPVLTVMMAGARPAAIPTNRIAAERGLGPSDPDDIEVTGDFAVIPRFKLPSTRVAAMASGVAGSAVYRLLQRRPIFNRGICTRCRRCADNCPVKAIAMSPYPAIDRKECIMCYCCAELCPEKAMTVPGPLRGLIQNITGR
jgi:ferredoxin